MHVSRQRLVSRAASLLRTAVMMVAIVFGAGALDGDGEWVPREFAPSTNVHAQECTDQPGGGDHSDPDLCEGSNGGNGSNDDDDDDEPSCSLVVVTYVCCVDLVTREFRCQPVYRKVCD